MSNIKKIILEKTIGGTVFGIASGLSMAIVSLTIFFNFGLSALVQEQNKILEDLNRKNRLSNFEAEKVYIIEAQNIVNNKLKSLQYINEASIIITELNPKRKASVLITLNSKKLTGSQKNEILYIITDEINDLPANNIVIIDNNGIIYK